MHMTFSAEELRSFVKNEIKRRGWSTAFCARQVPPKSPNESRGISRNAAYAALDAEGKTRIGTILRLAQALGFSAERSYSLRDLGIVERRRLHDQYE